jgi:glycine/D-amino acid oxidase-like deaminating enzyme
MLGAGAAGLTAALFLRQRGRSVVLVDELMGNLMTNAATVENFPGFPAGVPGPEVSALFQQQAILAGAEFLPATATGIEVTVGPRRRSASIRPRGRRTQAPFWCASARRFAVWALRARMNSKERPV